FHAQIAEGADPLLTLPLFRPATGPDGVRVMRRRDVAVSFRQEKPSNGLRIFVVGESSAWGFPFGPEFAFSRFLQERLQAAMPDRAVEVVNAAMPGIGSWHARKIVDEIANYRPDVILVYLGHNEFSRSASPDANSVMRTVAQLRFYQLAVAAGDAWQ